MGIISGFFIVMLAIGLISTAILRFIPQFQVFLKVIGSSYILWLAYRALRSAYQIQKNNQPPLTYSNGFMLQFINPKVIFFGLTIFTGFLHPLTGNYSSLSLQLFS
jgi:threonine/homoserine/homoserine lactone efflux protein